MSHFIILVILFAANLLNGWIPWQISLQIQVLRACVGFKDQFQIFEDIQIIKFGRLNDRIEDRIGFRTGCRFRKQAVDFANRL